MSQAFKSYLTFAEIGRYLLDCLFYKTKHETNMSVTDVVADLA